MTSNSNLTGFQNLCQVYSDVFQHNKASCNTMDKICQLAYDSVVKVDKLD